MSNSSEHVEGSILAHHLSKQVNVAISQVALPSTFGVSHASLYHQLRSLSGTPYPAAVQLDAALSFTLDWRCHRKCHEETVPQTALS